MDVRHRCQKMIEKDDVPFPFAHRYEYIYLAKFKQWDLYDKQNLALSKRSKCVWCDSDLDTFLGLLSPKFAVIEHGQPHRCGPMVAVEKRRNESKAHVPGDRSYDIRWCNFGGWTLFNRDAATDRKNLNECPFCRKLLPLRNQVMIE